MKLSTFPTFFKITHSCAAVWLLSGKHPAAQHPAGVGWMPCPRVILNPELLLPWFDSSDACVSLCELSLPIIRNPWARHVQLMQWSWLVKATEDKLVKLLTMRKMSGTQCICVYVLSQCTSIRSSCTQYLIYDIGWDSTSKQTNWSWAVYLTALFYMFELEKNKVSFEHGTFIAANTRTQESVLTRTHTNTRKCWSPLPWSSEHHIMSRFAWRRLKYHLHS